MGERRKFSFYVYGIYQFLATPLYFYLDVYGREEHFVSFYVFGIYQVLVAPLYFYLDLYGREEQFVSFCVLGIYQFFSILYFHRFSNIK
jgi:hypothetical protein